MSSTAAESEVVATPVNHLPIVGTPVGSPDATPVATQVSAFFKRAEALMVRAKARSSAVAAEVKASTNSEPNGIGGEPAIERASVLLDRTGETVGRWATSAAMQVRRAAALAREEAEDMLAEAQALRKK